MKWVALLGLQVDPMLVSMKTITTPTRPMGVSSVLVENQTYVPPKKARRKPRAQRYVDPNYNLVLYLSPDTDVDLVVKLIEWSMGIDWERTLQGLDLE